MNEATCPKCCHDTAAACSGCGHAANGVANSSRVKPPPPPVVANWVIHPVPPEIDEYFRQTFDEAAFLVEFRQAKQDGWPELQDLIAEFESELV